MTPCAKRTAVPAASASRTTFLPRRRLWFLWCTWRYTRVSIPHASGVRRSKRSLETAADSTLDRTSCTRSSMTSHGVLTSSLQTQPIERVPRSLQPPQPWRVWLSGRGVGQFDCTRTSHGGAVVIDSTILVLAANTLLSTLNWSACLAMLC